MPTTPVSAPSSARAVRGGLAAMAAASALGGCGGGPGAGTAHTVGLPPAAVEAPASPAAGSPVPARLPLHGGPVPLPLELRLPSLGASGPILAVGLTARNEMDAPKGPAGDPVWQDAFWYRGGGVPGDPGIATIAGHVDDVRGRPALFAHIRDLHPGDPIVVHDVQTSTDIRFTVAQVATYTVQQTTQPAILTSIYGAGPVAGTGPQPAPDGLSHLTLVTCAGDFVHGSYDHRVVVYAQRAG